MTRPLTLFAAALTVGALALAGLGGFTDLVRELAYTILGGLVVHLWHDGAKLTADLQRAAASTPILDGPTRRGGDPRAPVVIERPRLGLTGGANKRRPRSGS